MKKAILILIVLTSMLGPQQASAGFWTKQHIIATYPSLVRDSTRKVAAHEKTKYERTYKKTATPGHQLPGWPGIVSLILGILGFYPFFAVGAIVFGIIGLNKDRKHKGMALAGLILGAAFILTELVLVILLGGM